MTRVCIYTLIGTAVLILCGITAVQAGSDIGTSTCPVSTDHLAITTGQAEGEGEGECGEEQAKLYLSGPNSLVIDSTNGSVTAAGNSGALLLGVSPFAEVIPPRCGFDGVSTQLYR